MEKSVLFFMNGLEEKIARTSGKVNDKVKEKEKGERKR